MPKGQRYGFYEAWRNGGNQEAKRPVYQETRGQNIRRPKRRDHGMRRPSGQLTWKNEAVGAGGWRWRRMLMGLGTV
jgi:hypothetical protein